MWQAARAGIGIAIVLALVPASAQAEALVHTRRVHARIAAAEDERAQLERVLLELMQRLSVELVVADADAPPTRAGALDRYVARAFIDLRSSNEAVLYVHDPARDRILERRVQRTPGGEELVREELGHMLLAAVEALLAGTEVGTPSIEVPEAAAHVVPVPVPVPVHDSARPSDSDPHTEASEPSWNLRAAILYEVEALGHGPGVTHGPALAADLRSPWPLDLGLVLSAQYRFPFEIEPDPVGMRSQTFALRALPAIAVPLSITIALRFGLGAGADITRVEPERAGDDRIRAAERRTLVLAVGRALAGIDVRVTSAVSLWVALAADIDLDRSKYVLEREDGGESTITEPWRARPALWLGAALP